MAELAETKNGGNSSSLLYLKYGYLNYLFKLQHCKLKN